MTHKGTVLFCWKPDEPFLQQIERAFPPGGAVRILFPEDEQGTDLTEKAKQCTIMVGWRPEKTLLEQAINCSYFITPATGVQHLISLFREIREQRSIALINSHGNAYQTAQHCVALLLALTNRIIEHHSWMREGKWRMGDDAAATVPLRNKKVGFLGYGAINQDVHRFLSGFELEFAALKRHWTGHSYSQSLIQYKPEQLDDFLNAVDILIIALPLTSATRNMIGEKQLSILGEGALLLNVGRGPVVNEEALYQALRNKTLAGAAIDVWYNYQATEDEKGRTFPASFAFSELDNIVLSPHRAASPLDNEYRWNDVITLIRQCLKGNIAPGNIVDLDAEY